MTAASEAAKAAGLTGSSKVSAEQLSQLAKTQPRYADVFTGMAKLAEAEGPTDLNNLMQLAARAVEQTSLGWDTNEDGWLDSSEVGASTLAASTAAELLTSNGLDVTLAADVPRVANAPLNAALQAAGVEAHPDIAGINALITPEQRALVAAAHNSAGGDPRGVGLAKSAMSFATPKPNEFNIVFVGSRHLRAVSNGAASAGFKPYVTGVGSKESLRPIRQALTPELQDNLTELAQTDANVQYAVKPQPDAPPLLAVADWHMAKYPVTLPSPKALRDAGITQVQLLLENRVGLVDGSTLKYGAPVERAMGLQLEKYKKAGIAVVVRGLETQALRPNWDLARLEREQHLPVAVKSPNFQALISQQWVYGADYANISPRDAMQWLNHQRSNYAHRGPLFSAHVARIDAALREVAAQDSGR